MRKFISSTGALLMLVAFMLIGYSKAEAATKVEFNTSYSVGSLESFDGEITIPSSGKLTVYANGSSGDLFTSDESEVIIDNTLYGTEYGTGFVYPVSAGTYYYRVFTFDDTTLRFVFEGEGGGGTGGSDEGKVLPANGTVTITGPDTYTFIPPSNGSLKITFDSGDLEDYFKVYNPLEGWVVAQTLEGGWPNNYVVYQIWEDDQYVFEVPEALPGMSPITVTISTEFTPEGGGTGGAPEGWVEAKIGETYTPGEYENLYITSKTAGTLIVSQDGSYEAVLFRSPQTGDQNGEPDYPNKIPNEYPLEATNPYQVPYFFEDNQTGYVFFGPGVKSITFVSYTGQLGEGIVGDEDGPKEPTAIKDVYPAPGITYDPGTYYDITVTPTKSVDSWGTVTVYYGDESIVLPSDVLGKNGYPIEFLQIKLSTPGLTNYAEKIAESGVDRFTIEIEDLVAGGVPVTSSNLSNSNITVDNGKVTLAYGIEPAAPVANQVGVFFEGATEEALASVSVYDESNGKTETPVNNHVFLNYTNTTDDFGLIAPAQYQISIDGEWDVEITSETKPMGDDTWNFYKGEEDNATIVYLNLYPGANTATLTVKFVEMKGGEVEPNYTATLAVTGNPEATLAQVKVYNNSTDEELTSTNGLYAVTYTATTDNVYKVVSPIDAEVKVSVEGVEPGATTYTVQGPTASTENVETIITLYAGVDGKYIDIEVQGEGENEPQIPTDWEGMEWQTYIATGVGSIMLKVTPTTDGTLTAAQVGSGDSHLFATEPVYSEEYKWANNTPISVEVPQGSETLEYGLEANKTYYYVALLNNYDDLQSVTFSWKAQGALTNEIKLDEQMRIPANTVYTYTATEDGILSINVEGYDGGIAAIPNQQYFFYTNSVCTQLATALSADDSSVLTGWVVEFEVKAGKTYYYKYDAAKTIFATFAGGSVEAALTDVQPAAGGALDLDSPESTFNVLFTPANVKIGAVDLVYTNKAGVEVTLPLAADAFYSSPSAWQIALPLHITTEGAFNGESTAGSVLSLVGGADIKYVLKNVTYNGTPVNKSNVTNGVTVNNGTITISFLIGKVVTLESSKIPSPFLQYWPEGTPEAVATFTFSGDIMGRGATPSGFEISITEGALSPGAIPGEDATSIDISWDKCTLENNVFTVDFSGINMTGLTAGKTATIILGGVAGTDGLLANLGEGSTGQGFFQVTVNEATIPEGTVLVNSVTPANNSPIEVAADGTATFSIEFSDLAKVTSAAAPTKPEFTSLTTVAVNATNGYAKVWNFTFPAEYVYNMIQDEMWLAANITAESQNCTAISYGAQDQIIVSFEPVSEQAAGVDFDVTVPASAPSKLNSFTVSPINGFVYIDANDAVVDYVNPYTSIKIEGEDGFVAYAVAEGYLNGSVEFAPAIVKSGKYTITFPYNAFTIRTEDTSLEPGASFKSMAKEYEFNVTITDALPYMEKATLISPVVNEDGDVSADDFQMTVAMTWDFLPITAVESPVIATVINPFGQSVEVKGNVVPFDPNATEDGGSTAPDVDPTATTVLSFNIFDAAWDATNMETIVGQYSFVLPEQVVKDANGNYNAGQTFNFYVLKSEQPMTATFVIEAVESFDMNDLIVLDLIPEDGEEIQSGIEGNELRVMFTEYPAGYEFAVPADYEVLIAPSADLDDESYNIVPGEISEVSGMYVTSVDLFAGSDGAIFSVIISEVGGVVNPGGDDYEATFVFSIPEELDADEIKITNNTAGEELTGNIVDGRIKVYYTTEPTSFTFSVPDNYQILITVPEDLKENEDYLIGHEVIEDGYCSVDLSLYEGASGNEFGIVITRNGVLEPDLYSTTFAISLPADFNAEDLQVGTLTAPDENLAEGIENGKLTVYYETVPAGYIFGVPEGWTVTITAPSNLTAGVDYILYEGVAEGGIYSTHVDLNAGANGAEFTVTVAQKSGVATIVAAEDGKYVVFNVNGVMILSTDNAAELERLDAGLYIINGKKVLVNK